MVTTLVVNRAVGTDSVPLPQQLVRMDGARLGA
jgi:hypothetical protein